MRSTLRTLLACVFTTLSLISGHMPVRAQAPPPEPAPGVKYKITDLGTLGGSESEAWGLNSKGQVVGRSINGGASTAFVWTAKTGIRPLAGGFGSSWAYDINDSGHAAGFTSSNGITTGFLWDGQVMRSIGRGLCTNTGFGFSIARAINKFDALVGESMTQNCWGHAIVRYNDGRGMHDLGTFDPDFVRFNLYNKTSIAFAINDNNQVAGRAQTPEGTYRAFLWQDTNGVPDLNRNELQNLGTLGGANSYGLGMNNAGEVVGQAQNAQSQLHAFHWKPNAGMSDIGTLQPVEGSPGQYLGASEARDINNSGQIVGQSTVAGGAQHAFLYDVEDGKMFDLNDMIPENSGWELQHATAINDEGHVVGWGINPDGQRRAYLLRPHKRPLIFVPGIAGSLLEKDGQNLWFMGVLTNSSQLHIDTPGVIAPDVMRTVTVNVPANPGIPGIIPATPAFTIPAMEVYEPLLKMLTTTAGYEEYKVNNLPARRTLSGCDCDAEGKQEGVRPNLFVFAYDWRLSNDENADKLKDYIACVQKFIEKDPDAEPGDKKVNLLAHSMGGLVSRRYILKNASDESVDKFVSIASPYIGAPKLLKVMETGDFFANPLDWFLAGTLKDLIEGFKGAHELAPSHAYFNLTADFPFSEQGWDYNLNGIATETYTSFDQQVNMLDLRHPSAPRGVPGTNGAVFHDYAGQDDWSNDSSGVKYHHILGRQIQQQTIGMVMARHVWECRPALNPPFFVTCGYEDRIDALTTSGDGSVSHLSASRFGPDDNTYFGDLNARENGTSIHNNPKRYYTFQSTGDDAQADHNGVVNNPTVHEKIREFLDAEEPVNAGSGPAGASASAMSALTGAAEKGSVKSLSNSETPNALSETSATVLSNYLTVRGTDYVAVYDALGNSNTRIDGTPFALKVPNVTYNVLGSNGVLVGMPTSQAYHLTFRSSANPLYVELIKGVNNATPTEVIRYRDVSLPPGVAVLLKLTPEGAENLRYDGDGDGTFETVLAPTATTTGGNAGDTTPPTVEFNAAAAASGKQITLTATDGGAGVKSLLYSLDGTQFLPYAAPFIVDPRLTPIIYAFADDNAGNRSDGAGYPVSSGHTPVAPTLQVTGGTFIYDGQPHPATGSVTGANGEDLGALTYTYNGASEAPVNAGTYTVVAAFAGNDNYTPASQTSSLVIERATPTVNVTGGVFTYDGQPHAASGSIGGVAGEALGTLSFTYNGSTNLPLDAGIYAVVASFGGNANYAPASNETTSIVINKAAATISLSNLAYTYDGTSKSASAVTNPEGLSGLAITYNGSANAPANAGSYTISASLANQNYQAADASGTLVIGKATTTLSDLAAPVIILGTTSTTLGGKIAAGSLIPAGTMSITLHTATPQTLSAAIQSDGSFSAPLATGTIAPAAQPYAITYSYAGDANFGGVSGSATLTFVYGIHSLDDKTKAHKSGSTIHLKLQLLNVNGGNVSAPNIVVTALGVVKASDTAHGDIVDDGNSTPDDDFRYDAQLGGTGGYTYKLKTTGLSIGTYVLVFKVSGDPTLHTVQFQLR